MDTEERKETKRERRASEACVDIPDSEVDCIIEQIKKGMERLTKQSHDSITATFRATLSTTNNDNDIRFTKVERSKHIFSSRNDERKYEKDNDGRLENKCDHADDDDHFEDEEQDNHVQEFTM